jgi:hypothetical protein
MGSRVLLKTFKSSGVASTTVGEVCKFENQRDQIKIMVLLLINFSV